MGADFLSKVRDRVQKGWRAGYAQRVDVLPFPDYPVDRTTLRARLGTDTSLTRGDRVLLRLVAPASIEVIDGLQVVAECRGIPVDVLNQLHADNGIASGIVVGMGQLLSTLDVEVESAVSGDTQ